MDKRLLKNINGFDRFWLWLALHLPRKVVFFAALRVVGERVNDDGFVEVHEAVLPRVRHWFEEAWHTRFLRWSSQNLSDGKKPLWRHGRRWLWLNGRCVFSMEWQPGSRYFCTLHLDWGGGDTDRDLSVTVGFPLIGFYHFSLDGFLPEWAVDGKWVDSSYRPGTKFKMAIPRKIGVSVHDGNIWFSLWEYPMAWSSKQPWWWQFSFNPADFVLGRAKYQEMNLFSEAAVLELPEGQYPVMVKVFECTWKRPRWPWARRMVRAEVDCGEDGVPSHAGKGENSWDLEDDLTYRMTCPESTVEGAVKRLRDSIMRDRKQYGSPADLLAKRGAKV